MSEKKDNIIPFPTKVKAPDTLTVSFGDSDPITYTLSTEDLVNTVSITLSDYENFKNMAADWYDFGDFDSIDITTDLTLDDSGLVANQLSLDLDED